MRVHILVCALSVCLLAVPGAAAQAVENMPGYYGLEELDLFGDEGAEVDIDLGMPMMQIMAAAAEDSEPEFAELASQMNRIRVRVGQVAEGEAERVSEVLQQAVRDLENDGWKRMIRVTEDDQLVRLYSMQSGEYISGLALLASGDDGEVVLANIVGTMDPRLVGKVIAKLEDFPDLDQLGIEIGGSVSGDE